MNTFYVYICRVHLVCDIDLQITMFMKEKYATHTMFLFCIKAIHGIHLQICSATTTERCTEKYLFCVVGRSHISMRVLCKYSVVERLVNRSWRSSILVSHNLLVFSQKPKIPPNLIIETSTTIQICFDYKRLFMRMWNNHWANYKISSICRNDKKCTILF